MRQQAEPVDTDRLGLLPWSDDDLEPFAALCSDSRAMRFISRGRPLPRYELVPSAWGCGYATEGARRAVQLAWERTSLDRVISVTVPDHAASRRVMEKTGLAFQAEIDWRGTTVVWYAIDRPGAT